LIGGFLVKWIFIIDMLKRIPKSDITIRPFKAYKQWNFSSGSTEISVFEATEGNYAATNTTTANGQTFYQNTLYGQLRAQFYNGVQDNPFKRNGYKTNVYYDNPDEDERYLNGNAKVISIPQKYIGDGIKPGSVKLTVKDSSTGEIFDYVDDGYSNIGFNYVDVLNVSRLDFEAGQFNFTNYYTGTPYSTSVLNKTWDMENGSQITLTYQGTDYTTTFYRWDSNATPSLMYVRNLPFIDSPITGDLPAGNVFYNQGLIVLTRNSQALLNTTWSLSYNSTETIYEHEYLLIANEDEFNISTNPTSYVNVGEVSETFVTSEGVSKRVVTSPGIKYIRKRQMLENGEYMDFRYTSSVDSNVFAGFEHWDMSGSVDRTGSFLAPTITTIGLYDDDCSLLAVAKLANPIKSLPDLPINFLVRFDT
jgi:hypothetical protein